jgi:hypothetical protein
MHRILVWYCSLRQLFYKIQMKACRMGRYPSAQRSRPEIDSAMSPFGLIIIVGVDALPQGPVATFRTSAKNIAFRPFTFGCWSLKNGCRCASEGCSATKLIALCLPSESISWLARISIGTSLNCRYLYRDYSWSVSYHNLKSSLPQRSLGSSPLLDSFA